MGASSLLNWEMKFDLRKPEDAIEDEEANLTTDTSANTGTIIDDISVDESFDEENDAIRRYRYDRR